MAIKVTKTPSHRDYRLVPSKGALRLKNGEPIIQTLLLGNWEGTNSRNEEATVSTVAYVFAPSVAEGLFAHVGFIIETPAHVFGDAAWFEWATFKIDGVPDNRYASAIERDLTDALKMQLVQR